jgi:hypothetical protein
LRFINSKPRCVKSRFDRNERLTGSRVLADHLAQKVSVARNLEFLHPRWIVLDPGGMLIVYFVAKLGGVGGHAWFVQSRPGWGTGFPRSGNLQRLVDRRSRSTRD